MPAPASSNKRRACGLPLTQNQTAGTLWARATTTIVLSLKSPKRFKIVRILDLIWTRYHELQPNFLFHGGRERCGFACGSSAKKTSHTSLDGATRITPAGSPARTG